MTQTHSRFCIIDILLIFGLGLICCLAINLIPVPPAWAGQTPSYPVIRVVDGDTISIRYKGKKEKVRLLNVDTPESVHPDSSRNTPLGKKASAYSQSRLAGKRICLEFEDKKRGRYGRLLAYVILDSENFNLELVRQGWSPYYTKYGTSHSYHDKFMAAQSEARSRGLNLWHPDPATPGKRPGQTPITPAGILHGNTRSRVFHTRSCHYFNCTNCTRTFSSRKAALMAGFSPCKICRP